MTVTTLSPASLWLIWRRLYPIYCAMQREFVLEGGTCSELEEALDVPSAESFAEAEQWLNQMDNRIQVHHLRQFGQTSPLMNEQALRDFLLHHINRKTRNQHDRDKSDFLLIQLFSLSAAADAEDSDLTVEFVARSLEPVLGAAQTAVPEFLNPLDTLLLEASSADSLNAMFTSRVIERGRELKAACGERFFEPVVLAAFARFGFMVRRIFFRLMQQDLNIIFDGLRELESRGVTTLDCRKAQFAADEPVARLRMICQSWRVMFQAEYSSGQPLCILVDLRTAVEAALAKTAAETSTMKAAAAAASASGGAVAEFEISSSPAWEADSGGSDQH